MVDYKSPLFRNAGEELIPFPFQYERIEICTIRKKPPRHCERSAAIHVRALSTMDRHGLRPRDDDAGPQNKAA